MAYNAFLKDVQYKINRITVDDSETDSYVILEKESNNAAAFFVNKNNDNKVTRTRLNEKIDIELLPREIAEKLCTEGSYRLNNKLLKPKRKQ